MCAEELSRVAHPDEDVGVRSTFTMIPDLCRINGENVWVNP